VYHNNLGGVKMLFTKKYVHKGWKIMSLTDKEVKQTLKEHRKHCMQIMAECENDAETIKTENKLPVMLALFQKRAMQPFSFVSAALDEKIEKAKQPKVDEESKKLKEEKIKADSKPVIDKETKEVVGDEIESLTPSG